MLNRQICCLVEHCEILRKILRLNFLNITLLLPSVTLVFVGKILALEITTEREYAFRSAVPHSKKYMGTEDTYRY